MRTRQGSPLRMCGALLALTAVACGPSPQSVEPPFEVGQVSEALVGGNPGAVTSLVVRWRYLGNDGCSGVLVPTGGTTTRWVLTNEHCLVGSDENGAYNSAWYSVELQDGTTSDVDMAYPHPQSNWAVSGVPLGSDPTGKVDVALARLVTPVPVSEPLILFDTLNTTYNGLFDSARKDGDFDWSHATGLVTPDVWDPGDRQYGDNRASSTVATEGGDSGAPIWDRDALLGGRLELEALHSSRGSHSDGSGFAHWVVDSINRGGPFDPNNIDWERCTASDPCDAGEGDCDLDEDCKPGLVCGMEKGDRVGAIKDLDLCLEPGRQSQGTSGYCESIGGCQIYEGDCNSHAGCKGNLICRYNVGPAIGMSEGVDVCDLPRIAEGSKANVAWNRGDTPTKPIRWDYCTVDTPCALGQGDCNEHNHDTCRGYLKCKANVGVQFGFSNSNIDVCVHPDYL